MNVTEMFLDACRLYKVWCDTGKDAANCWDDYEAWDAAVIAFAKAINLSRSDACTYVFQSVQVK